MRYGSLYLFHLIYFMVNGAAMFGSKYYAEIGMSDSMIGVITGVSTVAALACSPMLALLTDRVPKKRYMLAAILAIMAVAAFLISQSSGFPALLLSVSLYVTFSTSALPLATTISLEYTSGINRAYGPIRVLGTVGYQLGVLLVGVLLSESLNNLYLLIGAILVASFAITFMMPNVEGHQHKTGRVPLSKLFADKHVRWLYGMLFFGSISTQFYYAFFSKHLGDLGMSNAAVSWITLLSVMAELPFLYFADRISRKTNIWNWILAGMAVSGVRWIGLAVSKSVLPIVLFQIPAISFFACFEYFPALYLNRRVPAELAGSAQNMHSLTVFGAAKIVGSLIGGQICEYTGIPTMFAINGVVVLIGFAVFWPKTRELIREEAVQAMSN